MSNYYSQAIQILESNGYKITEPRMQVLRLMQKAKKPLSPYDLQKQTDPTKLLNHVTIYRILELLVSLHLVHKVSNGGFVKCAIPHEEGCHHFVVCNNCGNTKEFADSHTCHFHLPKAIQKDFTITTHTFELNGLCKKCSK